MKNLVILLFTLVSISNASAQGEFTISGNISNGGDGKTIYLIATDAITGKQTADSAVVKNGKFSFAGTISMNVENRILSSTFPIGYRDRNANRFCIEATTMTVDITSYDKLSEGKMIGSVAQSEVDSYSDAMAEIMKPMMELNELFYKSRESGDTATFNRVNREMAELTPKYVAIDRAWREANPKAYMTFELSSGQMGMMKPEQVDSLYKAMPLKYRNSPVGKKIASEMAKLNKCAPGVIAQDFTATDINGKQFTFSSLKGHYVILDFWASWCKPCRASMPHVKALYEKYKAKGLEVVCVAEDDGAEAKWRKAVTDDKTELFHHVLAGMKRTATGDFDKSASISDKYAIHFLPTKYLVDAEGKIVDKVGDRDLEDLLKQIYGF